MRVLHIEKHWSAKYILIVLSFKVAHRNDLLMVSGLRQNNGKQLIWNSITRRKGNKHCYFNEKPFDSNANLLERCHDHSNDFNRERTATFRYYSLFGRFITITVPFLECFSKGIVSCRVVQ
ncbi:MAG: hypothetical protein GY820_35165 [Gammaproteobacteria bacterium]|nr:hypothetical protein [Gammaproteobacteria bacterium]